METLLEIGKSSSTPQPTERLTYSVQESADMLGIHYFTMYRLIQRQKIKTCRVLRAYSLCHELNCCNYCELNCEKL